MKIKSPLAATLIFTVLTFLQPALNIFLLPVYLQYFPAEDYGILQLMNNITVFVMIIGTLRINASVLTHYFDYKYQQKRLKDYLSTILKSSFAMGILFIALATLVGPFLFPLIFKAEAIQFFPYGILAIAIGVCWNFVSPYFIFLKNERVLLKYTLFYLLLVFVNIALHLLLIIGLRLGVEGALWAKLLTNILLVVLVMWFNRNLIVRKWKKYYAIRALQFSLPLLPFLIINWLQIYGDRFFLERFLDLKQVGVYSLLITLVSLVVLANDAVVNGIRPFLFDYFTIGIEQHKEKIHQLYRFYMMFCLFIVSGIVLVGTHIHFFTSNPAYLAILPFLIIATLVFFLRCYISLFYLRLLYLKRSQLLSKLSLGLAIVLILSLYFLVPIWGIWGAIIANLIANLYMIISLGLFNQKLPKLHLPLKDIFWIPMFVLSILFCFNHLVYKSYLSYPSMGIIQFASITILLLLFNGKEIQSSLKEWWPL